MTAVAVLVDLKKSHNTRSRTKFMEDPKAAATRNSALCPLTFAWHAIVSKNSHIYMRGTSEPNGCSFICPSSDGGG